MNKRTEEDWISVEVFLFFFKDKLHMEVNSRLK